LSNDASYQGLEDFASPSQESDTIQLDNIAEQWVS